LREGFRIAPRLLELGANFLDVRAAPTPCAATAA
jgi:hypothetical protein